jgi:hypothetical protein
MVNGRRDSPLDGASPGQEGRVRILYIAGVSHTGSTLLGHVLGDLEDTCYAGEVRNIWQRGIVENRLCTCDAPFAECSFWQAVAGRLPLSAAEGESLSRASRGLRTSRRRPFRNTGFARPETATFASATEALYDALAAVAQVSQIVDSSKSPAYAEMLSRLPTIDLRLLHLVRDPRATIYSHLRRDRFGYWGAFRRSVYWVRWNVAVERLADAGTPYARIRYEDFIEDPAGSLIPALAELGVPASGLPIEGNIVRLSEKHLFTGNRGRGQVGSVVLRNDLEWKAELSSGLQTLARATTFPILSRYGYRPD